MCNRYPGVRTHLMSNAHSAPQRGRDRDIRPGRKGIEIANDRVVGALGQSAKRIVPVFWLQLGLGQRNIQGLRRIIVKPFCDAGYFRPSREPPSPRGPHRGDPLARPQPTVRLDGPDSSRIEISWLVYLRPGPMFELPVTPVAAVCYQLLREGRASLLRQVSHRLKRSDIGLPIEDHVPGVRPGASGMTRPDVKFSAILTVRANHRVLRDRIAFGWSLPSPEKTENL